MTPNLDRERGILSPADREFLTAEEGEFSRQAAHAREREIRKRTKNAIKDFSVLFDELPEEEYSEIFGDLSDDALRSGIRDALSFFYHATAEPSFRGTVSDNKPPHKLQGSGEFDRLLEGAYRSVLMRHNFLTENMTTPTAEGELIDGIGDVLARAEAGETITPGEVYMLLSADIVDLEAIQNTVRKETLENLPTDGSTESSSEGDGGDPEAE